VVDSFTKNSLFSDKSNENEENNDQKKNEDSSVVGQAFGKFFSIALIVLLGLLMIPAILVTYIFHQILAKGRLRISVILGITVLVELFSIMIWRIFSLGENFKYVFSNILDFQDNWTQLIAPMLIIDIGLGAIVGFIICAWNANKLKKTPHLRELNGTWMTGFEYRRTPLEWFKRKKSIQSLKDGEYSNDERAPLGIEEKTDKLMFRYYDEANLQTLVSGGVGSGKALHKDTLIPTPIGLKTVDELQEKDLLFDSLGSRTEIIGKHQPMTEDHYLMTLNEDTQIKTCGDHQWSVFDLKSEETHVHTVSTRDIYESLLEDDSIRFVLPKMLQPVDYSIANLDKHPYVLGREIGRNVVNVIPNEYIFSSVEQRSALIAGIVDYESEIFNDGRAEITCVNRSIRKDLKTIINSMGWITFEVEGNKLQFYPEAQIFGLSSKYNDFETILHNEKYNHQKVSQFFTKVEKIDDRPEDYYCFEVDSPTHEFLCTENYVVTHNTITIQSLIRNDIENGIPSIIIDFKRDPQFAAKIAEWAYNEGVPFYHFVNGDPSEYDIKQNPNGQSHYDALKGGSATAKADMVLGMREYDTASAVYKSNMQQLLQVLFNAIHAADRSKAPNIQWDSGGIFQLASVLENDNLMDLAIACEGTSAQKNIEAVVNASKGKTGIKHALDELQGQMRTIIASEYGQWLEVSKEDPGIDLFELTSEDNKESPIILFSINSDAEPDFAQYMGSLILSDITSLSAKRRNMRMQNQMTVYVDEFQAVPPSSVTSLLEKSRASKVAMTLSLQSFEQIIKASQNKGEAYLKSILDTCGNFIIHAGATHESATRLSELIGQDKFPTYRASNKEKNFLFNLNWVNRRNQIVQTDTEERWIVPPSDFMKLEIPRKGNNYKSTAMIVKKSAEDIDANKTGATARKTWMIPSAEVLKEYDREVITVDPEPQSEESNDEKEIDPDFVFNDPFTDEEVDLDDYATDEELDGGFEVTPIDKEASEKETSKPKSPLFEDHDEYSTLTLNNDFKPESKKSKMNSKPSENKTNSDEDSKENDELAPGELPPL